MARTPTGLKLGDKYDIYQDIDLKKVTGVDLSDSPRLKEEILQSFIDEIVERTEDGKDIDGKKLDAYSDEYVESEAFKDANKSRSEINMTLSGDMLLAIDVISESGNRARIGFNDSLERKKAANHNNGVTVPKRQFFGITEERMEQIVREKFSSEIAEIKKGNADTRQTVAGVFREAGVTQQAATSSLFSNLFGDLFTDES